MNIEQFKSKYNYEAATPILKQYLDIKYQHLDCILLFRLGDFYEMFYEDAIAISKLLGITLTKRSNKEEDVPMCGIPYHALQNYLPKITEAGYRIAICEQDESAEEAKQRAGHKGMIERSVSKIITPGTACSEHLIAAEEPHYLAALTQDQHSSYIAYVDISTLEFNLLQTTSSSLAAAISSINPKEIIIQQSKFELFKQQLGPYNKRLVSQVDSCFAVPKCIRCICDYYSINTIESTGISNSSALSAIGVIVQYLQLTQKKSAPLLRFPKLISSSKHLSIDANTMQSLAIVRNSAGTIKGTVFKTLKNTATRSGARLLYKMLSRPLTDKKAIEARLSIIDFFAQHQDTAAQSLKLLANIGDAERSMSRISMKRASHLDLLELKSAMGVARQIKEILIRQVGFILPDNIETLSARLNPHEELHELISEAINPAATEPENYIKLEHHSRVQELTNLITQIKQSLEALRLDYISETGAENLKVGQNNMLGMYIEVSSKNVSKLGKEFLHRQSLSNAVRFTTARLQDIEKELINAKTLLAALEREIFMDICSKVMDSFASIMQTIEALSIIDVSASYALFALERNYSKPIMSEDEAFEIRDGRHPIVESYLNREHDNFVANSVDLSEHNLWIITGPNMAGKSTLLRQAAVIAIMAQAGLFVPASYAKIGIIDKVFSRVGASDDLASGQSTFMMEMLETSAILAQASHKSLIIIDELGRGTSTYDGLSIALACLEYIHDYLKCRALFATHYHELANISSNLERVKNYHVSAEEIDHTLIFSHKLKEGPASKSFGISVAKLAGLPRSVILQAENILASLQNQSQQDQPSEIPAPKEQPNESYAWLKEEVAKLDINNLTPYQALNKLAQIQEKLKNDS